MTFIFASFEWQDSWLLQLSFWIAYAQNPDLCLPETIRLAGTTAALHPLLCQLAGLDAEFT
jgi:hypothetical protein